MCFLFNTASRNEFEERPRQAETVIAQNTQGKWIEARIPIGTLKP
jgi:hypothetical protein